MFHKMWEWIKGHPYIAAAIAGVVVLYFLWPRKSSGASGSPDLSAYYAAGAAATQAATAAQIAHDQATIGYNTAKAADDAAVSISKTQSDRDTMLAQILAGTQLSGSQQVELSREAASAATVQHVSDNTTAQNIAGRQAQAATDLAQIGANRDVATTGINASVARFLGLIAGNDVIANTNRDVAVAGLQVLPAYAAQFVAGGYSPDYASYDIANLFGPNSQGQADQNTRAFVANAGGYGYAANFSSDTAHNPVLPAPVPSPAPVIAFPKVTAAAASNPTIAGVTSIIDQLFKAA